MILIQNIYLVVYQGATFQEQSSTRPDPEGGGFAGDEEMKQRLRRAFKAKQEKVKGETEKIGRP